MDKNKEIPLKTFTFGEVVTGLQQGKVFTRWHDGSIITMQIPANIKPDVIPNMQSLNPKTKELLSIKKGLYYHNQVLKITPMGEKAKATYHSTSHRQQCDLQQHSPTRCVYLTPIWELR
jgi:hypothetical protein